MIIIDFLYYYLAYWFRENQHKLKWSTPEQRASYALGLASAAFLYSVCEVLHLTIFKYSVFHIPKFMFLILGLGIMQFYDYIYIKRNRYEYMKERILLIAFSTRVSIIITIAAISLLIISPFIVTIIFKPFGGGIHNN